MVQNEKRKNPTMKDVAETAGVSVTTVSHVLNSTRFVSADATQRVEEAINKLNFKVNPIARNLRSGKSYLIGFVASNLESHFYVNIAKGIEKTIHKFGYQLVLIDATEKKENEKKSIESLYLRGVDGIIIVPTRPDCGYLVNLLPPSYPIVFVDRRPQQYDADVVLLDNNEAAYTATQRLIEGGCRRIGFVCYHFGGKDEDNDETMQERVDGYKQALTEAGIAVNQSYIKTAQGASSELHKLLRAESFRFAEELLDLHIEAIVCGNSLAAIGVFTCLTERGLHIGRDIKLITFDDDLWLSMTSPPISAIAQPSEALGSLAAKQLLKRMQGKSLPHDILRLKAELLYRGSS